jgi:outer membrane receptor protein involved in Fe transport
MVSVAGLRGVLLAGTALGVVALPGLAFAQTGTSNSKALEEVVVTATRQTSTVNKVALSVSAVTQKNLDQQGIRSVQDLSTQVPGFTFRVSGGDNNPNLTLRGIGGNAIAGTSGSAPTTGVYIDDIPLMKRNVNSLETGSGSPMPLLYDLDRIEVLRGPQGTLYGGSSEGGTLRFITPNPSLTTYSGSARLGVSTMQGGGFGNEEGLALGGPIVQDKLGFRISGFRQDRPGWVNTYSEWDGHQTASQINKGNDYSLRASLLWQITPSFKATVSVFHQMNYDQDTSTVRTTSPAVNVPLRTFANCSYVGATAAQIAPGGLYAGCTASGVNGASFSFPATVFGGYTVPAQMWLNNAARNGSVNGLYLTPTNVQYQPSPRRTIFTVPSVTLDYNWNDKLDFKSITAYDSDRTGGYTFTGALGMRTTVLPNYPNQPCPSGVGLVTPIQVAPSACAIAPQFLQLAANGAVSTAANPLPTIQGPANAFGYFLFNNRRGQVTQEFRVATTDPSWKLQFVGGAYIASNNNHVNNGSNWNENVLAIQMRGVGESFFAGGSLPTANMLTPGNVVDDVATRNIDIRENEQSAFGEVSYNFTSKFKLTAGVRVTNYSQQFTQIYGGIISGPPNGLVNGAPTPYFLGGSASGQTITVNGVTSPFETNPTSTTPFPNNYAACPGSIAAGAANPRAYAAAGCPYQYTNITLHEHPITPKIGGSYQLTPGDLIYATYSEGQRPGGVNPPVPGVQCASDFANLGVGQVPLTYQHDTVKSTEVGGKFRLFDGQAQVNASAFHIDWDNVQFVVPLPICAFSFIANAATASSDGAEVQITGRFLGFTVNGNVGYDNARYTSTVLGPKPAVAGVKQSILANKGDNLGVPDWTANIGVQYDTRVMDFPAYARMDYAYTGKYMRATSAGTSSFIPANTPNYINGNETHIANARVGIYYKDLEIAGYVKNLFDSREWINLNQGSGTYYFTGNTVLPRTIGVQMNYRF